MGYNIKGITVKIGADTSELQRELNSIKAQAAGIDKTMRNLKSSMKFDGGSFKSLSTYQQLLSNKIQNLTKQFETQKKAIADFPKTVEGWQTSLDKATTKMNELAIATNNGKTGTEALKKEYKEAKKEVAYYTDLLDNQDQKLLTLQAGAEATANNIRKLNSEFITTNEGVLKMSYNLDKASSAMLSFSSATKYLSMFSAGTIAGATAATISFEDAWAGVTKTVEGTPKQLQAVNDQLKNLALNTSSSYQSIAHYAELAGQMGIATDAVGEFTETVVMLNDTTNLVGDEAAQNIAKFANIMVDAESRTTDYYSRLGSTIVDLGNNFATTENDIMEMSMRIATAGRQSGLTSEQVLALATALSSMGIRAQEGGSSMSKMLQEIQRAVSTGSEDLNAFAETAGMTADEFKQAWEEDAGQTFLKFIEGISAGGDALLKLNELGLDTEVKLTKAMGSLAGSTDLYSNALKTANTAWEENTAMATEAEKRYATLKSTLSQTWEAIKQAGDELGQAFTPTLKSIADVIKSLAIGFTELDDGTKSLIANTLAFAAALSPLTFIGGKVAKGASSMIKAYGKLTNGMDDLILSVGAFAESSLGATSGASKLVSAFSKAMPIIGGVTVGVGALGAALVGLKLYSDSYRESLKERMAAENANFESAWRTIDSYEEYKNTLNDLNNQATEYVNSSKVQAKEAELLMGKIEQLTNKEKLSASQKELLSSYVERLNELYPELGLVIDESTGALDLNTTAEQDSADAIWDRVRALQEEYDMEARKNTLTATNKALAESQMQYDEITQSIKDLNAEKQKIYDEVEDGQFTQDQLSRLETIGLSLKDLQTQFDETGTSIQELQAKQLAYENYLETGSFQTIGETMKATFDGIVQSAQQMGIQIPQFISEGIYNGTISAQQASQYMSAMMNLQQNVNEAGLVGGQIPVSMANNILAQASTVSQAADYLNNLLLFTQMLNNAGITGVEIPEELATGVATGSVSVEDAVSQMMRQADKAQNDEMDKMKDNASTKSQEIGNAMGDGSSNAAASGTAMGQRFSSNLATQMDSALQYAQQVAARINAIEAKPKISMPAEVSTGGSSKPVEQSLFRAISAYAAPRTPTDTSTTTTLMATRKMGQVTKASETNNNSIKSLSQKVDNLIAALLNTEFMIQLQPQSLDGEVLTDSVEERLMLRDMLVNLGKGV